MIANSTVFNFTQVVTLHVSRQFCHSRLCTSLNWIVTNLTHHASLVSHARLSHMYVHTQTRRERVWPENQLYRWNVLYLVAVVQSLHRVKPHTVLIRCSCTSSEATVSSKPWFSIQTGTWQLVKNVVCPNMGMYNVECYCLVQFSPDSLSLSLSFLG